MCLCVLCVCVANCIVKGTSLNYRCIKHVVNLVLDQLKLQHFKFSNHAAFFLIVSPSVVLCVCAVCELHVSKPRVVKCEVSHTFAGTCRKMILDTIQCARCVAASEIEALTVSERVIYHNLVAKYNTCIPSICVIQLIKCGFTLACHITSTISCTTITILMLEPR